MLARRFDQNLLRWSLKQRGDVLVLSGIKLEFTPLEFETGVDIGVLGEQVEIRIYSVGVWNQRAGKISELNRQIRIYSVGVWNIGAAATAASGLIIRIYSVGVWNYALEDYTSRTKY